MSIIVSFHLFVVSCFRVMRTSTQCRDVISLCENVVERSKRPSDECVCDCVKSAHCRVDVFRVNLGDCTLTYTVHSETTTFASIFNRNRTFADPRHVTWSLYTSTMRFRPGLGVKFGKLATFHKSLSSISEAISRWRKRRRTQERGERGNERKESRGREPPPEKRSNCHLGLCVFCARIRAGGRVHVDVVWRTRWTQRSCHHHRHTRRVGGHRYHPRRPSGTNRTRQYVLLLTTKQNRTSHSAISTILL